MAPTLRHWRNQKGLTQVDAALLLGVSQPYLSRVEKGIRPLSADMKSRMEAVRPVDIKEAFDTLFASNLSALGYPGFAHLPPARSKRTPQFLLMSVLAKPDACSRVAEALRWLVREYADKMDLQWLVRQAKLKGLQNRLGFLLQLAAVETPGILSAARELELARQATEATFCWDSMPAAVREWMRTNRTPLAAHWNVVARLSDDAAW